MSEIAFKSVEQESAEADVEKFRHNLGPFVVAAQVTRMAMVFTDAVPGTPIIFANDSFLKLTGYSRDEVLGQSLSFLLAAGTTPETMTEIEAALASDCDNCPDIHYRRKDATEFWASIFVSPVRDDTGVLIQHFVSFVDLTKHKQEQTHCRMLIDELNHRVKNTLSTVQSIVTQALRRSSDREIAAAIESRLHALSRSHDLLTRESWEGVGLHDLVRQAMEPFGIDIDQPSRFIVTGTDIRLTPKASLALGIAFNELGTNAVKYGSLSTKAGSVRIDWKIDPSATGNRLKLRWQEIGGPPVTAPVQRGFGSRVLEQGLAFELAGAVKLNYVGDGLVCTVDVPLQGISA